MGIPLEERNSGESSIVRGLSEGERGNQGLEIQKKLSQ